MDEQHDARQVGGMRGGTGSVLLEPGVRHGDDYGPGLDVLRLAADSGLTELVPRMRFDLSGRSSRVMEVVEGTPASAYTVGAVLDPMVAAAIGGAIGAWHTGTAGAVDGARAAAVTLPAVQLVRDPLLQGALAAASASWRPKAIIHGDCSVRNAAVVTEPCGCGRADVVLTAWSRSGRGDPAWDLGCLVAELLHAGATALVEPALAAGVVAYGRTTGGLAADRDLPRRVTLLAVARLVALALDTPGRRDALAPARAVAAGAEGWTARLERWLW